MRNGDILTLRIERLGTDGVGRGKAGNRTVEVPGTVPGDCVEVRVKRLKRHTARAELCALNEAGVERIDALCPHFAICGGCRWQDIPYQTQLKLKAGIIRDVLEPIAEAAERFDGEVVPSPDSWYYRNKMEFTFDRPPAEPEVSLGLHELGRYNSVFDVTDCRLQSVRSNQLLDVVRRFIRENGLSAYGLKSHRGLLRFLAIREGALTGDCMVNIVTSGDPFPGLDELCGAIMEVSPSVSTIVRTINRSRAGVATGEEREVLMGSGIITDRVGAHEYFISPDSFFQTNTRQAANLYRTIGEFCRLTGTEQVLDLYCGTGTIGISVAAQAASVTGIELVEDAVRDARLNAEHNSISNIDFLAGKVEMLVREGMEWFDVVICDPPRAGIHPRAMDQLVRMRIPRMVYVSCNCKILPQDLSVLMLAGYRIRDIRVFDMSPHTPHIETVVLLEL